MSPPPMAAMLLPLVSRLWLVCWTSATRSSHLGRSTWGLCEAAVSEWVSEEVGRADIGFDDLRMDLGCAVTRGLFFAMPASLSRTGFFGAGTYL